MTEIISVICILGYTRHNTEGQSPTLLESGFHSDKLGRRSNLVCLIHSPTKYVLNIWRLKLTYIRTLARSNFNIQSLNESIPWDELQDEFFLSIVKVYPFFLERIIPVHNAEKIRDGGAPKPNGSPIARVTSLSRQKFQFLPSVTRKTDTSIRLGGLQLGLEC